MKFFWELREREMTGEMRNDKKLVDQVKEIEGLKDEVRDAIIEKWLTYIRIEQGSNWLTWRKWVIKRQFNKTQKSYLRHWLNHQRQLDDNMLGHRDKGTNIELEAFYYLPKGQERIERMFPLLDPELDEYERIQGNKVWFKHSPEYLNDWENEDQKTEF